MIEAILTIATLIADWFVYKKMGREGWEGIIPFYSTYVLFEVLYGNGWKMLLLLIPFYNIYLIFKMNIDWAHAFNKSTGFGVGMVFFPYIFNFILALTNAQFGDGSKANSDADILTKAKDAITDFGKDDHAVEKIAQLNDLKEKGIITEEEFEAKKDALLKKI